MTRLEILVLKDNATQTSLLGSCHEAARKEIGLISIGAPHTRKSLVKGERFIRNVWRA